MDFGKNSYAIKLVNILIGRFKWYNLPKNISSNQFEFNMLKGAGLINFDDVTNKLYTFYPSAIDWDINGIPDNLRGNSVMGGKTFNFKNNIDCVLFPNCYLDNIYYVVQDVNQTAKLLNDIDINIKKNLKQLGMPILARGTDETKKSVKNILNKVLDNATLEILVDDSFNADSIRVLDINAPYLLDKYFNTKINIINNFYNKYGISSVNEKRERLTNEEIGKSLGGVYAARYSEINAREFICNFLNEKYGLNIRFEFCDRLEDDLKPDTVKEGVDDEQV